MEFAISDGSGLVVGKLWIACSAGNVALFPQDEWGSSSWYELGSINLAHQHPAKLMGCLVYAWKKEAPAAYFPCFSFLLLAVHENFIL